MWQALPEGTTEDVLTEAGFDAVEEVRVPTVVLTLGVRPVGP